MNDGPTVGVVVAVENQGFERSLRIAFGCGQKVHGPFEHVLDADAVLGRGKNGEFGIKAQVILDLSLHPFDFGGRQVDLVDHGNDLQVMAQGQVEVGQGLGLHTLTRVHDEKGSFAGRQGPGHFIGKIHMAGGVDQVEDVLVSILGLVRETDRLALDGDTPFPFDVHGIENLILEFTIGNDSGGLNQPVGQGGLAVVDMGDNAEISDILHRLTLI